MRSRPPHSCRSRRLRRPIDGSGRVQVEHCSGEAGVARIPQKARAAADFWHKVCGARLGGVGTRARANRIHRKRLEFSTSTKRRLHPGAKKRLRAATSCATPTRQMLMHIFACSSESDAILTMYEARRIAVNAAKLPDLLKDQHWTAYPKHSSQ
jgi:hypothetical protein